MVINCLTPGWEVGNKQLPLRKTAVCTGEQSLGKAGDDASEKQAKEALGLVLQLRQENAGLACRKPRVRTPALRG